MAVLGVNPNVLVPNILGWALVASNGNVVVGFCVSTIGMFIFIFGWLLHRSFIGTQDQRSRVGHFICDDHMNESYNDDVRSFSEGDTVHRSTDGVTNAPVLEPKHKIFLSHSGAQKEFVEHLCKALEDRSHYPFFDRRHESLPKGERFPNLIIRAAQQCQMLIVVVSEEYFMSKWPMIELSAFVKAHRLSYVSKSRKSGRRYYLCFMDYQQVTYIMKGYRKKWFQQWKTLVKANPKNWINLKDWKYAFDILRSFNGLQYDRELKEIVAYEEKIVSHVCKSIAPDLRWDDSHVQGKSGICKIIGEKIEGIGVSRKYKVKVVGVYGVGGSGKTTICMTLCNELWSKYEGRVCHIEFPSVPSNDSKEFSQKVLRDLMMRRMEFSQHLNDGQCKDILRSTLFKQRTFLAIDNICDNLQSIQLAKAFLELPYHMDSLVVVTARSPSIFQLLGLDGDAFLDMPDLREADAVRLFLHHAASGQQFFEAEEKQDILTCVQSFYFSKGHGQGHHYHPLVLQAMGVQLGCHGGGPSHWVKNLPLVRDFKFLRGGNLVFDSLRRGFDLLPPKDQTLFMDVGHFSCWDSQSREFTPEWLCAVHKQDEEEITHRLELLKHKGLLQAVDLRSGTISMHDLYREFARLEVKGCLNESLEFAERKWLFVENGDLTELESKPAGGCRHRLIRLTIEQCRAVFENLGRRRIVGGVASLERIKWDYFSNLEVLQLRGLHLGQQGVLNLGDLMFLRILELDDVRGIGRVEGLENLNHLTYFTWMASLSESRAEKSSGRVHIVGRLPSSLKLWKIWGENEALLSSEILARCHQLSQLELHWVEARSLDLSNCWALERVTVRNIRKLRTLLGLAESRTSNLQYLEVQGCEGLVDMPGIDRLSGLQVLKIWSCPELEVPSLLALTELQVLRLAGQERLVVRADDFIPRQLQELRWDLEGSQRAPSLGGCNQLEVLDLSVSAGLTTLADLGDLPALREFNLGYCEHLLRLPDLSKSRNLQELNLKGCDALQLCESAMQMLSKLPILQPVPVSGEDERRNYRLDLARGKVLVQSSTWGLSSWELWKEDGYEERDLGAPPIRLGTPCTWEYSHKADHD